jgi:hypothetical protein
MSIVEDAPMKKARLVSGKTALALQDESVHVTTDNNVIEKRTAIEEIEDSKSGDEDDFDASDFSNIVSVATEKLEGGREWTRRTRSVEDSARTRRPGVPAASSRWACAIACESRTS